MNPRPFLSSHILFALVLLTTQTACTADSDKVPPVANIKPIEVVDVIEESAEDKSLNAQAQVDLAGQDLAERLGIELKEVKVSSVSSVVWRSGALGCPMPGMNYTQALVNGVWILLQAENTTHRYHAKTGGQPFYCPLDRAELPAIGQGAD